MALAVAQCRRHNGPTLAPRPWARSARDSAVSNSRNRIAASARSCSSAGSSGVIASAWSSASAAAR
jgi:hypothetical protein